MSDILKIEREGTTAILTMNNPAKMNAFNSELRDLLTDAFEELSVDSGCRAVILTGAGGNFSAGGDLKGFNEKTINQGRARLRTGSSRLMRAMVRGAKPVIAAVEGYAVGAGMALPSACDYVVASSAAKFSAGFMKIGFVPDLGMMWTLPRRVGLGRAKKLMALSNEISAAEAERIGLVEEIAEPGKALEAAMKVAEKYAHIAPLAFELLKDTLAEGLDEVLKAEIDMQPILMLSEDHEEGKRAFFEKRRPKFTGR